MCFAVHLVDGAQYHVGAHALHEGVATVAPAPASEDLIHQLRVNDLTDLVCL